MVYSAWNTEVMFPASDGVPSKKKRRKASQHDDTALYGERRKSGPVALPETATKPNAVTCAYCDCKLTATNYSRDHFRPRSKGGRNVGNIVICCKSCNALKADMEFESIEAVREFVLIQRSSGNRLPFRTHEINKAVAELRKARDA